MPGESLFICPPTLISSWPEPTGLRRDCWPKSWQIHFLVWLNCEKSHSLFWKLERKNIEGSCPFTDKKKNVHGYEGTNVECHEMKFKKVRKYKLWIIREGQLVVWNKKADMQNRVEKDYYWNITVKLYSNCWKFF